MDGRRPASPWPGSVGQDSSPSLRRGQGQTPHSRPERAHSTLDSLRLGLAGLGPWQHQAWPSHPPALGLGGFFTAGRRRSKAWTDHISAQAPEAKPASSLRLRRGFIKGETTLLRTTCLLSGRRDLGRPQAGRLHTAGGKDYVVPGRRRDGLPASTCGMPFARAEPMRTNGEKADCGAKPSIA